MDRTCNCIDTVRDLPDCPAHGVFPTASKRIELEDALEEIVVLLDGRNVQGKVFPSAALRVARDALASSLTSSPSNG